MPKTSTTSNEIVVQLISNISQDKMIDKMGISNSIIVSLLNFNLLVKNTTTRILLTSIKIINFVSSS